MGLGLGMGLDKSGSRNGTIPFKSDALFWLDGTILDVTGTKYFVDKISGKNFLITGYDFDSTWLKGFPYKSAATISAPAGDATLIAADINSYLYTAGTPNQIPVISLFQDVDYEHKLFCRHSDQRVDGNGVEMYEPRVLDVVLYNTVKAAADLTKCQSYFGVPAIDATAKWIDPINGVDASGDGTQGNPYKTHAKVLSLTLTEGTLVYCQSGTFAPFAWNKNYQLKGIGLTKILNVSGSRGIDYDPAGTLAQTIEGYIIDMANVASSTCWNGNITHALTLKRMYFTKYITNATSSTSGANVNLTISNSICTELKPLFIGGKNIIVDTCFVKTSTNLLDINAANSTKQTIKNSNLNAITTSCIKQWAPFSVDFFGNKMTDCNVTVLLAHAAATSGTHKIFNNVSTTNLLYKFYEFERAGYVIEIYNNTISYTEYTGILIKAEGDTHLIYNNIIQGVKTNSLITIANNLSHNKTCVIRRNKLICKNLSGGYHVTIGEESLSANNGKITSAIVEQNRIKGPLDYAIGATGIHGVMIGFVTNLYVKHNYISGCTDDLAVKGTLFTDSYVAYNIFAEAYRSLVVVSSSPLKIYNNTVYNSSSAIPTQAVIVMAAQPTPGGVTCDDSVHKNNIYYNDDYTVALISQDSSVFTMDYNVYKPLSEFSINAVVKTFAQFQALGNEANGRTETIAFDSNLIPTVPVTGGEDLGTDFDDGLDASTSWGSDTQLPVVVTKQQGAAWDIGAYVH